MEENSSWRRSHHNFLIQRISKRHLVGGFNPSEKYESQLGSFFPIYGKIKNVPNHQPDMILSQSKPAARNAIRLARCPSPSRPEGSTEAAKSSLLLAQWLQTPPPK